MEMYIHAQTLKGRKREIRLSEPIILADNEPKGRSGHLGHAMTLLPSGKIMAFSPNTSGDRYWGHSAFGWMEYRISEDYGESFGEPRILPYSMDTLLRGVHTVSVEKAITLDDGTVAAFCLINSQKNEICCEPWSYPTVITTRDEGETWSEPLRVAEYRGRIYDVLYHEGAAYVLLFCNDAEKFFCGSEPEHVYRLFKSTDGCQSFEEVSVVAIDSIGRGYGNMIITPEGELIVYAYNQKNEDYMDYAISHDLGKSWDTVGATYLKNRIRNPQVGLLDGQFIMHGRAGENESGIGAFVLYTSADGISWDEGTILVEGRAACFYSENLTVTLPDGRERMLVQYSENYKPLYTPGAWVNSMLLTIESV